MASSVSVQRVAVVGPGGAGKSTFARQLGRRAGLPVIPLDEHYWRPGWVETPAGEWRARQRELVAGERWIMDGNYGSTFDVRFARADTVVVVMPGRLRCLLGAIRRTLRHHGRAVQAPGCAERIDWTFLVWIWRYRTDSRPRLDAALDRYRAELTIVELGSRTQVAAYLRQVS